MQEKICNNLRDQGHGGIWRDRQNIVKARGIDGGENATRGSPGCYGETLYLYMAQDLHFGATHPDEDEFLELQWMPLEELTEKCLAGEIQDAKTQIALMKTYLLEQQKKQGM